MKVPTADEAPTITVEQAAHLLGLGRTAAYEAVRAGQIPSLRFGRRVKVPTAALRQMLGLDPPGRASAPGGGPGALNEDGSVHRQDRGGSSP